MTHRGKDAKHFVTWFRIKLVRRSGWGHGILMSFLQALVCHPLNFKNTKTAKNSILVKAGPKITVERIKAILKSIAGLTFDRL